MIRAVAVNAFATGALVLYSAGLASAHVPYWRHHARYAHAQRVFRPARVYGAGPAPIYQTYAGYEGYGGVPEDPLIPLRTNTQAISRAGQSCYSLDDCDRKDYDESGTRGRLGLGASPYHPEGPGNPR